MSESQHELHGGYAVTWPLQPPTPLEVWLAENFCHGPGHVLSHRALVIANQVQQRMPANLSDVEGSLMLRSLETECADAFQRVAARFPYPHWLLVFRALRNALQATGHPWIPNLVTDVGLSLSRDIAHDMSLDIRGIVKCHIPREDALQTVDAISHLVVYAYLSALRRRVEKGQNLRVTSLAQYISGRIRESDLVTSGLAMERDIEAVDARIEAPTPTTLHFAVDGELDVVPLWFGDHVSTFGDTRLLGDPSVCNPWWLAFLSFPRSFPVEMVGVSPTDVSRVRALLNATPPLAYAKENQDGWATRLGVLGATEESLQMVPVDEIVNAPQRMLMEVGPGSYVVDLGAASDRIQTLFAPGVGGATANVGAKRFEVLVQEAVDFTPWRPEGALRSLIGRNVRGLDGRVITDIDAVATKGDVLILIDCKNHGPVGDTFAEVRNRREAYAKQAALWGDKVRRINEARDSLGIPASARIEGVVVVPKAGFMDSGIATEEVAGMTRVMGIWDLYQRLRN